MDMDMDMRQTVGGVGGGGELGQLITSCADSNS